MLAPDVPPPKPDWPRVVVVIVVVLRPRDLAPGRLWREVEWRFDWRLLLPMGSVREEGPELEGWESRVLSIRRWAVALDPLGSSEACCAREAASATAA